MEKHLPLAMGDINQPPMPLYVVANRKLSVADLRDMMRDHFEGTPMDMSQDIGSGLNHVPYRWRPMDWELDGKMYFHERAIATQQTGFVLVAQLRNWLPDEVGGILWFGVDDANTAVFTPMYANITEVPECYRVGNGDMMNTSWTSAFWILHWVANMAYHYDLMIDEIRELQVDLESGFDKKVKEIDQEAVKLLETKSANEAEPT